MTIRQQLVKNLKATFRHFGFEVSRASSRRKIGCIQSSLNDLKKRGFQPKGIVDVGANKGAWTRMVRQIFLDTPVRMYEPQTEMKPLLNKVVEELPNVAYRDLALGPDDEQRVQTIWEDRAGSSFMVQQNDDLLSAGVQRKTQMTTINMELAENPEFYPSLVKLDVQGFELEVLKGASELFDKTEVFISETSLLPFFPDLPQTRDVINFMYDRGYVLFDITEFLHNSTTGLLGQVDLAFVPENSSLRNYVSDLESRLKKT